MTNPGQQVYEAHKAHAEAKNVALIAKRKYERALDVAYIMESGSVEERKAKARQHESVIPYAEEYDQAQIDENLKRAELDGLSIRFEAWRSLQAMKRAEMNLA